jgi:uncharacterized Fe-S cluster-containing radical SAM superfamily protein
MRAVSLPIFVEGGAASGASGSAEVDRSGAYASCRWLEEGIAFNRRSLNACLIVHHHRGFPFLCDFNGGEVDLGKVLAARAGIIKENQHGGHESCRGCPHLATKRWRKPRKPIGLMAIAQFSRCNIECNYCYLQTQDRSVFEAGFDPYEVLPAIKGLVRDGACARKLVVDWGGGEPTVYGEFDETLEFLTRAGATTWVHSNGTRLPRPIAQGMETKRVNILCSVDAGKRETWKRMKRRDLFEVVWRNLGEYVRTGCRVVLKYIVKEENCGEEELRLFVERAVGIGAKELVIDIDYDFPVASEEVMGGIRMLRKLAMGAGIYTTFGSTGAQFTPEEKVGERVGGEGWRGRWRGKAAYWRNQVRLGVRSVRVSTRYGR